MINAFTRKISKLLEKHDISSNDINKINTHILNELHDSQKLHQFLENHIMLILKKYDINYLDIYELRNQMWEEIMHFKFAKIPKWVSHKDLKERK